MGSIATITVFVTLVTICKCAPQDYFYYRDFDTASAKGSSVPNGVDPECIRSICILGKPFHLAASLGEEQIDPSCATTVCINGQPVLKIVRPLLGSNVQLRNLINNAANKAKGRKWSSTITVNGNLLNELNKILGLDLQDGDSQPESIQFS